MFRRSGIEERLNLQRDGRYAKPYQVKALANAEEATALWLETAQEHGDPIPQPKGRQLRYA